MQIVVDDLLTNYQVIGDKPEVILLLHGWMRSLTEWMPVAKQLSDRYTIILLDLPGFGNTPRPNKTYSVYDYGKFVEHFLDKLEYKKVILVGHSFGGRIGIILGAKTQRLSQLILVDSAAIEKKDTVTKLRILINKLAILPFRLFLPQYVDRLKEHVGSSDYQSSGEMRDIFIKTVNEDLSFLLPDIQVKTNIIWGEKDSILPISDAIYIKEHIKNAHLRVVWGAGHSPYIEKPKEFIEILNEIL